MVERQPIVDKTIDLGFDPRDPWGVIRPEARAILIKDLRTIADKRREAEVASRNFPMP